MDWLLLGILAGVLVAESFALAFLRASRVLRTIEHETKALAELSEVESPSGMPFFATRDSLWELAGTLEDPRLR